MVGIVDWTEAFIERVSGMNSFYEWRSSQGEGTVVMSAHSAYVDALPRCDTRRATELVHLCVRSSLLVKERSRRRHALKVEDQSSVALAQP